jgi:hypothetical protein
MSQPSNIQHHSIVLAFFSVEQGGGRQVLEELLKQYIQVSSRIKYEFVDPDKNPARATNYEIKDYGTIVLEAAKKQEKILEPSEEALTNALIKVTREGKKVVYFLKGHGEHDLGDMQKNGSARVLIPSIFLNRLNRIFDYYAL